MPTDFFSSQAESLSALFAPRAIAVVGASSNAQKIGGIPVDYQRRFGFEGALYPVNPNAERIQELPAFPSLRAIGQPVDLGFTGREVHGDVGARREDPELPDPLRRDPAGLRRCGSAE